jgi:membrane carboxypeptidase/penicillin-binding protein PbpC
LVQISQLFYRPNKSTKWLSTGLRKSFVTDYLTIKHRNGLTDVLYNASVYKDDKGNVLGVFAAARCYRRKMFEKEMIDAKFLQKLLQSQTTVFYLT